MDVALSIFGVAFAALCVWLTVRVINRRERWAKWTGIALVLIFPSAYLMVRYVTYGVPPGEEESEGVTIKVTATVLALAAALAWSIAWIRFGRSNHPSE